MPTNTDEFTRYMIAPFDETDYVSTPTAFQTAFFGNPANGSRTQISEDAELFEADILRADGQRLAATVHRGRSSGAANVRTLVGQKFTNEARQYPLIEEYGSINSDQLLKRMFGEDPRSDRKRLDRLRERSRTEFYELIRRAIRTGEFFAREAILTGKHPAMLPTTNANLIYDFHRKSTHIFTPAVPWSTIATATPLGDVDDAIDLQQQDAHVKGDGIIMAGDVFEKFIKNADVQVFSENRRMNFMSFGKDQPVPPRFQRWVDAGFDARGEFQTYKGRSVVVFTYDGIYTDDFTTPGTDVVKDWMPNGKAVVFFSGARMDRFFGPADRLPIDSVEAQWFQSVFGFSMQTPPMPPKIENSDLIVPSAFHLDAYPGQDKKTVALRVQYAPVYVTTHTDSLVVLEGLV